jgi:hypothetical protein
VLAVDPHDLTAAFFMENALKHLHDGVPENWTGAEEMRMK